MPRAAAPAHLTPSLTACPDCLPFLMLHCYHLSTAVCLPACSFPCSCPSTVLPTTLIRCTALPLFLPPTSLFACPSCCTGPEERVHISGRSQPEGYTKP